MFTIVGFPHDVRGVYFGDRGVLSACAPGAIVVDMTTSSPQLAVEIHDAALAKGVFAIDAPVSGGDIGAREARLSIMIGGDAEAVQALGPCWEAMGKTIVHQGGAGAGQHTKMVNQTLIASNMIGVCEALLYGYRAGLNLETVLQSVSSGAAGSWSLSQLAPRILNNRFEPGFAFVLFGWLVCLPALSGRMIQFTGPVPHYLQCIPFPPAKRIPDSVEGNAHALVCLQNPEAVSIRQHFLLKNPMRSSCRWERDSVFLHGF